MACIVPQYPVTCFIGFLFWFLGDIFGHIKKHRLLMASGIWRVAMWIWAKVFSANNADNLAAYRARADIYGFVYTVSVCALS